MKKDDLKSILAAAAAVCFMLSGCSKNKDLPTDPIKINLSTTQTTLVSSGNSFAFDIFRAMVNEQGTSGNIMISPLSISYALTMTMNGANGVTRDSMLKALRLNGVTPENINDSYKELTDALIGIDSRVKMSIANSVWVKNDFEVKKSFTDILTDYYAAESKQFSISDPTVPATINSWISDKTNGLIKDMVSKLDDNTVMLLINAIYFKGKWKSEFDKDNTVSATFYKPVGTSDVSMMKQESDFGYYNGDGFIMGEFPYGQGNYVMDVILPDATDGIHNLMSSLTQASFNTWIGHLSTEKMILSLPKFKYGFKDSLEPILSRMGMGIAFTDAADFSNISNESLLLNDVLHQTFIQTDEEGTEAAAATISIIGATCAGCGPLTFNADHPFIYIIRETTTNTVLFMGIVADPAVN